MEEANNILASKFRCFKQFGLHQWLKGVIQPSCGIPKITHNSPVISLGTYKMWTPVKHCCPCTALSVKYTTGNMHIVCVLLGLKWLGTGQFYPYLSGLLHWHWGNLRLPQCQWNNPEKQLNKSNTLCIIHGICCASSWIPLPNSSAKIISISNLLHVIH